MFSHRCFSSAVKQLSQLQVQVLELISGLKEHFLPVRLLCWAAASDKPWLHHLNSGLSSWEATGQTRDAHWADGPDTGSTGDLGFSKLAAGPAGNLKQHWTPVFRQLNWVPCTSHSIIPASDTHHTPVPYSKTLLQQHSANRTFAEA